VALDDQHVVPGLSEHRRDEEPGQAGADHEDLAAVGSTGTGTRRPSAIWQRG
jgi:hypothetical protein